MNPEEWIAQAGILLAILIIAAAVLVRCNFQGGL